MGSWFSTQEVVVGLGAGLCTARSAQVGKQAVPLFTLPPGLGLPGCPPLPTAPTCTSRQASGISQVTLTGLGRAGSTTCLCPGCHTKQVCPTQADRHVLRGTSVQQCQRWPHLSSCDPGSWVTAGHHRPAIPAHQRCKWPARAGSRPAPRSLGQNQGSAGLSHPYAEVPPPRSGRTDPLGIHRGL